MPKKIKKDEIELWRKMRADGLSLEEIGKRTGYTRQTIAKHIEEPAKPKAKLEPEAHKIFSLLNPLGKIAQRRCPHGKKIKEGYCEHAEFPKEDWTFSEFEKLFPNQKVVVRGEKEYLRPKIEPWFCYFCEPMKAMKQIRREMMEEANQRKKLDAKLEALIDIGVEARIWKRV